MNRHIPKRDGAFFLLAISVWLAGVVAVFAVWFWLTGGAP
jgi:hypothetical protein